MVLIDTGVFVLDLDGVDETCASVPSRARMDEEVSVCVLAIPMMRKEEA